MHGINFEYVEGEGFRLTDFPNAEKLIALKGALAQELADIALHQADLLEAEECLDLSVAAESSSPTQRALWKMAIITFAKCFGRNEARANSLDIQQVLPDEELGQAVFRYFKHLRNKNIAHDENAFTQCLVGAVINSLDAPHKVEKIVTMTLHGETGEDGDVSNLRNLIHAARRHVDQRYDRLCEQLTSDLEAQPHDDLVSREGLTYRIPTADEVRTKRSKLK